MLLILDHEVPRSNPADDGIQLMTVRCFIAKSLSLSAFHCLDMTEMMLKRDVKHQGPVVQSIVCLTSSLVVKMLTVLVNTISN